MNKQHVIKRIIAKITFVLLIATLSTMGMTSAPDTAIAQPAAITLKASTHKKSSKSGPYITPKVEGKEAGTWVSLKITGKTKAGKKISETKTVKIGKKTDLKLGPGSYTIHFAKDCVASDTDVYTAGKVALNYKKANKKNYIFKIAVDRKATKQKADEKAAAEQKAAEEKAAAEQAAAEEAQRQAEEQERQRQEAEAQAQAQAEAERQAQIQQQQQAQQNEQTVYVTRTGDKYHKAGCRYLRQSQIPMSLSQAQASGYTPCSICGG